MEKDDNESVKSDDPLPDPYQINTSEMINMRDKCKEYEESLKHRYFKITTSLKDEPNVSESEDEEPQRPMRF